MLRREATPAPLRSLRRFLGEVAREAYQDRPAVLSKDRTPEFLAARCESGRTPIGKVRISPQRRIHVHLRCGQPGLLKHLV